jgi:hypothetical protein
VRIITLITAAICLASCSTTVNFYPIEGPLAAKKSFPSITATVDGIANNTGGVAMSLPNGETCSGKWASAAPQYAETVSLMTQYGTVSGFATGIKPGVNRGEAFIVCSQGTTIQAEFYTGSGTANGYGIAKDSNGNVYKMIF